MIQIRKPTRDDIKISAAVYSPTKAGKTFFVGTAKKPVILSMAAERGAEALYKHPNHANIDVIDIPQPGKGIQQSVIDAINYIASNYQQQGWTAVGIDTYTILLDMVVNEMTDWGARNMRTQGNENDWGKLQRFAQNIRDVLANLPLHVIWTFHVNEVRSGDTVLRQEPLSIGKSTQKYLLPSMNLVMYLDKVEVPVTGPDGVISGSKTVRRLWPTCPPDYMGPRFLAGGKFDEELAGEPGGYVPDFEYILQRIKDGGRK